MQANIKYHAPNFQGEISIYCSESDSDEQIIAKAKRMIIKRIGPVPKNSIFCLISSKTNNPKLFNASANHKPNLSELSYNMGMMEFADIQNRLLNLQKALEHNFLNKHWRMINVAKDLINQVENELICKCPVPKADIPINNNLCLNCHKPLLIKYYNSPKSN